jgi:hypothetical protein
MKSVFLVALLILNLGWSESSQAEVSPQVRSRLDFLIGKKSKVEGPNCWNESTYVAGISKGLHHTTGDEFGFLVDSPLCTQVPFDDAAAGDIVALRRVDRNEKVIPLAMVSEVHGYSYVDSKMGLTKNGTMSENAYELMSHDDIFSFYRKSEYTTCKMFGLDRVDCKLKTFAYRCEDLESYLSKKGALTVEVRELLARITSYEEALQPTVLSGEAFQEKEGLTSKEFINQVKALQANGLDAFIVDYLFLRIESIGTRSW